MISLKTHGQWMTPWTPNPDLSDCRLSVLLQVMSLPDKQVDGEVGHAWMFHSPPWAADGFVVNKVYKANEEASQGGPASSKLRPWSVTNFAAHLNQGTCLKCRFASPVSGFLAADRYPYIFFLKWPPNLIKSADISSLNGFCCEW